MATASPEKGLTTLSSVETNKLIVRQPAKLAELGKLLETFENLNARVSERVGEDISGDMGGAGMGAGAGQGDDSQASPRDIAIKNIPPEAVMKERLTHHIEKEVRKLEKLTRAMARSGQPGSAYRLNELYARIRRLNSLLAEIATAAYEVLRRLFIRVFVDQQAIV